VRAPVAEKLNSVFWDFTEAKTGEGPHGIHPYPARFIPQIPRALIRLFHPGDDAPVLDPFCGSGTSLVEALYAGIPSVGIDLHPLATLIAKVKTTPLSGSLVEVAKAVTRRARAHAGAGAVAIPPIPRIDHWFRKDVQEGIAAVVAELNLLPDRDAADALRVALSSIIVRVSNQESDTRYAAIEKGVSQESVWLAFERAAVSVATSLAPIENGLFPHRPSVRIITKDLLTVEPEEIGSEVGLVVTSPPYPNAYEYWLYHKYRMYWLGMDPIAVREREIGARAHYFKKNHQTEDDFERQMGRCFWLLARVMRKGSYACFVVGRSIIHAREIDNEALLERAAAPHGFWKAGSVARNIPANRKSFNLAHGTINREQIVVFAFEGA
jgi:site-specific DNA-methyltransferase (cytosine-N4-specific)